MRTRPGTRGRLAALLAVSMALTVGCGSDEGVDSTSGSDLTPVKIEYVAGILDFWPILVADEKGFFEENGIAYEPVTVTDGASAMAGLSSSSIDVVAVDLSLAGPLMNKGMPLSLISGLRLNSWIVMASNSADLPNMDAGFPESIRDLEGKTLGVHGLGTSSHYWLQALLQAAEVPLDSVTITPTGGQPETEAAVASGRVDAAVSLPDGAYAMEATEAARKLFSFADPEGDFEGESAELVSQLVGRMNAGVWVRTEWAESNPDMVAAVRRSIAQAITWMHDPGNADELFTMIESEGIRDMPVEDQQGLVQAMLPLLGAHFSEETAAAQLDFAVAFGIMEGPVPVDEWYTDGIPETEEAVAELASGG